MVAVGQHPGRHFSMSVVAVGIAEVAMYSLKLEDFLMQ